MKARVIATGEIVEIVDIDFDTLFCNNGGHYTLEHLEGIECDPDYWTRLEHQYAGTFLQALISYGEQEDLNAEEMVEDAMIYAHALVEKLKESK